MSEDRIFFDGLWAFVAFSFVMGYKNYQPSDLVGKQEILPFQ